MSLQHLAFKDIDEKALAVLVSDRACETKTLEFKQDLQVVTDEQKREFLSDVTALANSDGGDLVFGLSAEKGVAKELVGLRNFVPDDRIGQLENLLRDFVQPRLTGLQLTARPLSNGTHALLIRVGRSFAAPHMVRHQGVTRFCGRNSAGKYDLDIQELRSTFLASEAMSDKLKNFRLDRINRLISVSAPVTLTSPHLMVLHLLPVVSARPDIRFGTSDFQKLIPLAQPQPIGSSSWGSSFNMDGLLVTSNSNENCSGYIQIFRNGFFESVESRTLRGNSETGNHIPGIAWEQRIIEVFPTYVNALQVLNLPPPYVASLSLLNVRDYYMYVGPSHFGGGAGGKIDRDHLLTDEVLIESVSEPAEKILRPLFDQIWNGCGWPQSINYNKEGDWKPRY